jgi:Uma2 family endonuclease
VSTAELPAETEAGTMTFEEFMALPDDGTDRELIRGVLKVRGVKERGMTIRNRHHAKIEIKIGKILDLWLDTQPEPRGEIVGGEAGFRLRGTKESGVGIDVAYASAELVAATPESQALFDGPPVLAVEILSPTDKHEDIAEKVRVYLEVGTVAWVVDPDLKTVVIYRPAGPHRLLNIGDQVADEPYLPGFRARVADFFA